MLVIAEAAAGYDLVGPGVRGLPESEDDPRRSAELDEIKRRDGT